MKVNSKILMFFLAAIACDASANLDGYYIGLGLGKSNGYVPQGGELPHGKYGGAGVYSFAVGKQFNENVTFDIDMSYRGDFSNNNKKSINQDDDEDVGVSIQSLSMMLSGYYYYANDTAFKPYVTGGVGLARNKVSNLVISGSDEDDESYSSTLGSYVTNSFAWKVGLGTKYVLNDSFDFDVRYQYVDLGNVKTSNLALESKGGKQIGSNSEARNSSKLRSHEFLVGIAYKF